MCVCICIARTDLYQVHECFVNVQVESLFSQVNSDVLGLTLTCGQRANGGSVLYRLVACSEDGGVRILSHDKGQCLTVLFPMFLASVSHGLCCMWVNKRIDGVVCTCAVCILCVYEV